MINSGQPAPPSPSSISKWNTQGLWVTGTPEIVTRKLDSTGVSVLEDTYRPYLRKHLTTNPLCDTRACVRVIKEGTRSLPVCI